MAIWKVIPVINNEEQGEIELKLPHSYKSAIRRAKELTGASDVYIKPKHYLFKPLDFNMYNSAYMLENIQVHISLNREVIKNDIRKLVQSTTGNDFTRDYNFNYYNRIYGTVDEKYIKEQCKATISWLKNYVYPVFKERFKRDLNKLGITEHLFYNYTCWYDRNKMMEGLQNADTKTTK